MKREDKGFSLVELVVVVAIMAVLMTILAPQVLRYVEHSKRSKDVSAAEEMVHQIQVLATYYNGYDYDVYEDPLGGSEGLNSVTWQKDAVLAGGKTEAQIMTEWAKGPDNSYNFGGLLFQQLGEIPVSSTNRDYTWKITYNPHTGEVKSVYLLDMSDDGLTIEKQMQLYPDSSAFLSGL